MEKDNIGEQVKTVYAHFGLAIYQSQVLEHGLVNALLVLDLVPNKAKSARSQEHWASLVDQFFDENFRHTLGRMIQNFKSVGPIPPNLETLLTKALEKRNWLAHHYFRERAEDFMSSSGREKMVAELEDAQNLFRDADKELEAAAKPLFDKYGFTEAKLKAALDDMRKEVQSDL